MAKFIDDLLIPRHEQDALAKLRDLEAKLPSPEARFAIPWVFRSHGHFRSILARQNPHEIEACYRAVIELRPATVVEIGTNLGGTFYLWAQAAREDALLVSMDLEGGDYGGGYPDCRASLYQAFAREGQRVELLRGDSHSPRMAERLDRVLDGRAIDFLFIDGDHSYAGVRQDLLSYGPRVRPGGWIGFHDTVPRTDGEDIQVDALWRRLEERYPCREFTGPPGSRAIGIGLLEVPAEGLGDLEAIPARV